jgi:hypothetical protein
MAEFLKEISLHGSQKRQPATMARVITATPARRFFAACFAPLPNSGPKPAIETLPLAGFA